MTELTAITFNYEEIDPETRISLKQRASRIGERTRRMATDIWENGREFAEAQQELAAYGNGRFLAWIESETGYSKSTVYRMIDVHQRLDFPKLGRTDIAASALYLLASASTPDEAREEIMGAAEQGEAISYGRAKEIVGAHKHKPSEEEINKGLFRALHSYADADLRWENRRQQGLTDQELTQAISSEFGIAGSSSGPGKVPICHRGGTNPRFWFDSHVETSVPTLQGAKLRNAVRELMKIPFVYKSSEHVERNQKLSAQMHPETARRLAIWELERYVRAWVASDSPGKGGFSDPLSALRNIKNKFGGWRVPFDSIKATMERPFNDGDLRQAVNNVIAQEEAGKRDVLNGEQTAVPEDYNYADELQKSIEAAETAVSQPKSMVAQVLEEVEHYEKEMETAVSGTSILGSLKSTEWLIEEMMTQTKAPPLLFALNKAVMAVRDAMDVASKLEETAVSQEVSA